MEIARIKEKNSLHTFKDSTGFLFLAVLSALFPCYICSVSLRSSFLLYKKYKFFQYSSVLLFTY